MRNKGLIRVTAVTLLVLFLAACSGRSHDAAPTTSAPIAPPTTARTVQAAPPTSAAPNPDVIPPVITAAYVNAVFAVLNHIYGNATRSLRASHAVTPQVKQDLRAIFNDPLYAQQIQAAKVSLNGAINNVRPDAGDGTTVVTEMIAATPSCVFVETKTNLSAVLVHPTPTAASEYYKLALKDSSTDPQDLNPTPWALAFNVAYLTPTTETNQCVV
jgi:hypothetical protein